MRLQIKHFFFLKSEPFAAIMTNNSWMRCHTVHSAAIMSLNHSQTHFTRGVTVIICTILQLSCLFSPSVKHVGVVKLEMCGIRARVLAQGLEAQSDVDCVDCERRRRTAGDSRHVRAAAAAAAAAAAMCAVCER